MKSLPLISDGKVFKIIDGDVIAASGEIHCYHGYWTLLSGFVSPEYRGRGFHRRLIRARVKEVFKRGGTRVRAWVDTKNAYCLNNLIEEGFRFIKIKKRKFSGVYHVCLVLTQTEISIH